MLSKKFKKFLIVVILVTSIVFSFVLLSCEKKNESGGGGHGTPASPPIDYICEYSSNQDAYDLNNITLMFTIGLKNEMAIKYFYYDYLGIDSYTEEEWDAMFEEKTYPLVPIYLYFYSFGNKYLIKSIDDFLTEDYIGGQQMEITIPSELFYNEYGLIRFEYTDYEDGSGSSFLLKNITFCNFYYKKDNDKVYISDNDLMPEGYLRTNELTKKDETFPMAEIGFKDSDLSKQDYCALYCNEYRQLTETNFEIGLYYGHLYKQEEKNIPSIDLYVIKYLNNQPTKTLIKTVDDYMSDDYLCVRTFDYYGKLKEIVFSHSEKIVLTDDYFVGDSGRITFSMYEAGTQNLLSSIDLSYETDISEIHNIRHMIIK